MNPPEKTECVLVKWAPSRNSSAAILTLLGMTAAYAVLGAIGNIGVFAFVGLIVVPVLAVGVPVYWTTHVERQPISALCLTTKRWLPSLGLSILLSLVTVYQLLFWNREAVSMDQWLLMTMAGAFALFEPFFIFTERSSCSR